MQSESDARSHLAESAEIDLEADKTGSLSALLTFLIADVRGYTRFTVERGDEAAARLALRFAEMVNQGVSSYAGRLIELRGDEALAVFPSARGALRSALDLQRRFREERTPDFPLYVGIGLDAGEAISVKEGYRGTALNLAARLCSLAGPDEILATETVANLARKTEGVAYAPRGAVQFKGFADPVTVMQVQSSSGDNPAGDRSDAQFVPATALLTIKPANDLPQSAQQLPFGGFLGALPEGVFAAREADMERVVAALEQVLDRRGHLMLLAGEPGVGKTRLAQEITLAALDRGFVVATGRCYATRATVPFYPWFEILATIYRNAPENLRLQVGQRSPYLARLLPDFLIGGVPPVSESAEEQERLFRAVSGFIEAVASEIPVALLVDDLHWADSASLELMQHLARETLSERVLMVGTYRNVEINRQHPLARSLRELTREQLSEEIVLPRLPADGTKALIAATMGEPTISDEFIHLVHRHTDGNPFFIREVLRSLVERGDIFRREDGTWDRADVMQIDIPHTVRDAIGERLARLEDEAQELLREASVLGQNFRFEDLQGLSGREEDVVEQGLGRAQAAGLVRGGENDTFAFAHALIQQTLYEDLPPRRRRRLHRAAGEALEHSEQNDLQRRAGELAWHFMQGDDKNRALTYSLLAGKGAEIVFAYHEATTHYTTAEELARGLGDDQRLARALEGLGTSHVRKSRYDLAVTVLETASDLYRRLGDRTSEARVVGWLGHADHLRGRPEAGIRRVRALLDEIGDGVSAAILAPLYVALAHLYFASGKYLAQMEVAELAVTYAREAGDVRSQAAATLRLATAHGMIGQYEKAVMIVRDAVPLAEQSGDLDILALTLNNLAEFLRGLGLPRDAMPYRDGALDAVRRIGDVATLAYSLAMSGWSSFEIGDAAKAAQYLEEAVRIAQLYPDSWRTPYAYAHCGRWLVFTGDYERADLYLWRAVTMAEHGDDLQAKTYATVSLALLDLLRHRPKSAKELLHPLLDANIWLAPEVLCTSAEAHLELGQTETALELANKALALARDGFSRFYEAHAQRTRGRILAVTGSRQEAVSAFMEGLVEFRRMEMPLELALSLYYFGTVDAGSGVGRGREHLEEALRIFRQLNARPFTERAERALEWSREASI